MEGEPGIGKTRLLAELRERADSRGHLVLAGSAAEFERDMPFGVWVGRARRLRRRAGSAGRQRLGRELLAELAGVLPSLRGREGRRPAHCRGALPRPPGGAGLLERLAEPKPLVLVLDDLHWCDGASIELIAALLRRGPRAGAARPRVPAGSGSRAAAAALAAPAVERLELGQLSEAHAEELLGVDAPALTAIYRHGGGNPFYLEQLARASEAGRLPPAEARGRAATAGCPPPWRRRWPRSWTLPAASRALLDGGRGRRGAV